MGTFPSSRVPRYLVDGGLERIARDEERRQKLVDHIMGMCDLSDPRGADIKAMFDRESALRGREVDRIDLSYEDTMIQLTKAGDTVQPRITTSEKAYFIHSNGDIWCMRTGFDGQDYSIRAYADEVAEFNSTLTEAVESYQKTANMQRRPLIDAPEDPSDDNGIELGD